MGDLISKKALMSRIESEMRKWGEDYDAEQILGDIEDFPSAYDKEQAKLSEALRELLQYLKDNPQEEKRMSQCLNCKILDTCDTENEDENGMCKNFTPFF